LGRVLLLGAGKSSLASLEYLIDLALDRVDEIMIVAGPKTVSLQEALDALAVKASGKLKVYLVDHEDINVEDLGGEFDLCIVSPGISEFSDLVENARKVCDDVISEVEFAFREAPSQLKWIAITGTNGKTTTVSLITHILKRAGKNVVSVGNIGNVCIQELKNFLNKQAIWAEESSREDPIFVVEVSSFQLALCKKFAPSICGILNITPDHISWHKNFENYRDAKLKLFQNLSDMDFAILDCTDPELKKCQQLLCEDKNFVQLNTENFTNDEISFRTKKPHKWGKYSELKIKGEHNKHNSLLAAIVCIAASLSDEEIESGLKSFKALEHRLEKVAVVDGVTFINDSKATNVEASLQALTAYPPGKTILLYGGKDKGTNLSVLAKKSHKVCKEVICYGECGLRFFQEFFKFFTKESPEEELDPKFELPFDEKKYPWEILRMHIVVSPRLYQVESFDDAFALACELAQPGDYVVLSPACASFDEFSCFEERGEHFKELVGTLTK
ncbi:MAG: UDP-N-acetylmuramoyl-L-alanine--D-glutamate ligase, partial [Eggerthellaceae bacterium]|nr:UDP-N-acetylmuramoyl-L-alanine--D-glutamate ligase [Eggerthellaceae bacterium]